MPAVPPTPPQDFCLLACINFACLRLPAQNTHLPIPDDLLSTWMAGIALLICRFHCEDADAMSTLLPVSRVRDVGRRGQLAATGIAPTISAGACLLCLWNSRSTPIAAKINGGTGGGLGIRAEMDGMGQEGGGCLQVHRGKRSQVSTHVPGCHEGF